MLLTSFGVNCSFLREMMAGEDIALVLCSYLKNKTKLCSPTLAFKFPFVVVPADQIIEPDQYEAYTLPSLLLNKRNYRSGL